MECIEYFKIAVTVGGILMGYHKLVMVHMEKRLIKLYMICNLSF